MKKYSLKTFAVVALCLTLASCQKEKDLSNASESSATSYNRPEHEADNPDEILLKTMETDATRSHQGHVYTTSNETGQNAVLHYTHGWNGDLSYEGSYATGGDGAGMPLGSQGAIAMSANHKRLFAVNAGDNTLSSFKVNPNGSLVLQQTISSGGVMPVSVTVKHGFVYVVNSTSANIMGFELNDDGMLEPIEGSSQSLSAANAMPAQIMFGVNNRRLYVTEKMTNKISVFNVNENGVAGPTTVHESEGETPFGFEFARNQFMIVSEAHGGAPNASSVSSYKPAGMNLITKSAAVPNDQTAACWVATTHYGMYAFVTNTGSNTISTYYVNPVGHLYSLYDATVTTGMAPTDIAISGNNFFVYNVNEMSHTIGEYQRGFFGTLNSIGEQDGLPEFAAGLVAF